MVPPITLQTFRGAPPDQREISRSECSVYGSKRPSFRRAEDPSKLTLPINEVLGEGNLTEQRGTGRRRFGQSSKDRFEVIPPTDVRSVEAYANCMGAKAHLSEILKIRRS